VSGPTFLDLAASIDRVLHRNINFPYRSVIHGAINVTVLDYFIDVDATGGNTTVTLPDLSVAGPGMVFIIKRIDLTANSVTVQGATPGTFTETIDGAASEGLFVKNDVLMLISGTTEWRVIASNKVFAGIPDHEWSFAGQLDISHNTDFVSFKAPRPLTFVTFDANVNIAPTGSSIIVDWLVNGGSQPGARVIIAAGTFFSSTTFTVVLNTGDTIQPQLTQVGSTIPGSTILIGARGTNA
jgi:hypothetical protein